MKKIIWRAASGRIIPNYGVVMPDNEITLPDDLANQFVAQGDAEEVKPTKRETRVKENEQ